MHLSRPGSGTEVREGDRELEACDNIGFPTWGTHEFGEKSKEMTFVLTLLGKERNKTLGNQGVGPYGYYLAEIKCGSYLALLSHL